MGVRLTWNALSTVLATCVLKVEHTDPWALNYITHTYTHTIIISLSNITLSSSDHVLTNNKL